MKLIDTHCHFDDPRLDDNRSVFYKEAVAAGVILQIIPGVSRKSWSRVKNICESYAGLYPCYGLHPFFVAEHQPDDLEQLRDWLRRESPVAVGECGLDYFMSTPDKSRQWTFFEGQLDIAAEFDLPVVLHANRAVEDVTQGLRRSRVRKGVIHSYNGSLEQARQLLDLGFRLGFGGALTYDRATRLRKLLQDLPADAILIETDAPDQPPSSHKGEINAPARLVEIFTEFCNLRHETPENLADQLNQNAMDVFGIRL